MDKPSDPNEFATMHMTMSVIGTEALAIREGRRFSRSPQS